MNADALYKVAYDEAVRALSEQQDAIESLRGRAGLLLSIAAVTTSFLGAQASKGQNLSACGWLALIGFVAVVATSLAILWPGRWEFTANPREVMKSLVESDEVVPSEDLHRDLSLQMHDSYLVNYQGINHLAALFQMASSLLAIEVVLWIAAIASDL